MELTDLTAFLDAHRIDADRVEHPAVMTVEESEGLVPPLPGGKTKNLFLRDKKGTRHFLVTGPQDVRGDLGGRGGDCGAGGGGVGSAGGVQRHRGRSR